MGRMFRGGSLSNVSHVRLFFLFFIYFWIVSPYNHSLSSSYTKYSLMIPKSGKRPSFRPLKLFFFEILYRSQPSRQTMSATVLIQQIVCRFGNESIKRFAVQYRIDRGFANRYRRLNVSIRSDFKKLVGSKTLWNSAKNFSYEIQ